MINALFLERLRVRRRFLQNGVPYFKHTHKHYFLIFHVCGRSRINRWPACRYINSKSCARLLPKNPILLILKCCVATARLCCCCWQPFHIACVCLLASRRQLKKVWLAICMHEFNICISIYYGLHIIHKPKILSQHFRIRMIAFKSKR